MMNFRFKMMAVVMKAHTRASHCIRFRASTETRAAGQFQHSRILISYPRILISYPRILISY